MGIYSFFIAAPVYSGISSSGIYCQSKPVMLCSFLSWDVCALNPTSSSSLRIVSQCFNVKSGLDLELHSQLVSISPSLLTFALRSETLVFTGSGIGVNQYEVLVFSGPFVFVVRLYVLHSSERSTVVQQFIFQHAHKIDTSSRWSHSMKYHKYLLC